MTTYSDAFRRCAFVIFAFFVMALPSPQFAFADDTSDEIKTLAAPDLPHYSPIGTYRAILCVAGYKFFQTITPVGDKKAAVAVSTVQIYEEKDGKALPARCK